MRQPLKIQGKMLIDYLQGTPPSDYLDGSKDTSQVFTINKGTAQGTTFKIDAGGFVFSCLFDSGTEISCMNMDTVAHIGFIG